MKKRKIRGERRQAIYAVVAANPGVTTGKVYEITGAIGNLGKETYTRASLRALYEMGHVERVRANRSDGNRGARNYAYFPATVEGRRQMRQFVADGAVLTEHIPQARTATADDVARRAAEKAPTPSRGRGRPRKSEEVMTTYSPTPANGSDQPMAQGLVRINLKDGAHDIPVREARTLLKELHEIFA